MKKYNTKQIVKIIKSPITEFLSFDKDIVKYMSMHWIGGVFLIYATLLPVFMNKLGLSIVNAGIIFSIAAVFDVVLTYIISKFLDRISPNTGMTLDWITESLPALIYGFASTSFHFVLGAIAGRVTNVLNPVYKVYENEIFPEEQRSLIYTYHLITPEVFTIILYPLIGYLLTYKFTSIMAFRIIFWVCGIAYLFVSLIPYKSLRWVKPIDISTEKTSIRFSKNLYMVALAEIMVFVGFGFTSTLLTSYYILDKMNGTVMDIHLLEVVGALIILVTGLFTKNLNSKISEEKIAQYGIIFLLVFAVLMIIARSYKIILVAYVFQAIGNTVWFPHHYSLLMKFVPKEKRGEFFGGISSLRKLIGMILPLVSGFLAKAFGFFVPFSLALICFVTVCIVYQRLLISRQEKDLAC